MRFRYPEALGIICSARNTRLDRPVNEIQGLQRLFTGASDAAKRGVPPDWVAIRRATLRCKPGWSSHVDDMVAFVVTQSGGKEGHFISYLAAFWRQFAKTGNRKLDCSLFQALANLSHQYSISYNGQLSEHGFPAHQPRKQRGFK